MKVLSNKALPPQLSTFVSAQRILSQAIVARGVMVGQMSGYPVPSHVVARVRGMIDLSSLKAMKEGIMRLRDLTRLASDVLFSISLAKMDRFQMIRSELMAYISENAGAYGQDNLTDSEKEFVAYLITSSESAEASWILDYETEDKNLMRSMYRLYHSLMPTTPVTFQEGSENISPSLTLGPDDFIFDPDSQEIVSLTSSGRFAKLISESVKLAGSVKNAKKRGVVIDRLVARVSAQRDLSKLADLRILDHVFMLLMDTNIWSSFVSPRVRADAAQNEERARSLKTLSAYLHSLLLYTSIFDIELFKQTYEKFENWYSNFPALPKHIDENYKNIIVRHDLLGAAEDARAIYDLLASDKDDLMGTKVTGYLTELTHVYGIEEVIEEAASAAQGQVSDLIISDLKLLADTRYNALLLNHPIAPFNMIPELTRSILLGNIFVSQMTEAFSSVLPSVSRFFSDDVITRLTQMRPRPSFSFSAHVAYTSSPRLATPAEVSGKSLRFRALTPGNTYDYEEHVRRSRLFSVFKASEFASPDSKFLPKAVVDCDVARHLREIAGREWKSLHPSFLALNDAVYDHAHFRPESPEIERMFENISGQHFEIIRKSLPSPYLREIWATYLSSFCLLYLDLNLLFGDKHARVGAKKGEATVADNPPALIAGHGAPYGLSYQELADKQGPATPDSFVKVAEGIYIRFLVKIPIPTFGLVASDDFFQKHPYYYFAGNSEVSDCNRLVYGEGLLNFALRPVIQPTSFPDVLFDKRYAYLNDSLLIQTDIAYRPAADTSDASTFRLPLVTKAWHNDRFVHHVSYESLGEYSQIKSAKTPDEVQTEVNTLVTEMEKQIAVVEAAAPVNHDAKSDILSSVGSTVGNSNSPSSADSGSDTGEKSEA